MRFILLAWSAIFTFTIKSALSFIYLLITFVIILKFDLKKLIEWSYVARLRPNEKHSKLFAFHFVAASNSTLINQIKTTTGRRPAMQTLHFYMFTCYINILIESNSRFNFIHRRSSSMGQKHLKWPVLIQNKTDCIR